MTPNNFLNGRVEVTCAKFSPLDTFYICLVAIPESRVQASISTPVCKLQPIQKLVRNLVLRSGLCFFSKQCCIPLKQTMNKLECFGVCVSTHKETAFSHTITPLCVAVINPSCYKLKKLLLKACRGRGTQATEIRKVRQQLRS